MEKEATEIIHPLVWGASDGDNASTQEMPNLPAQDQGQGQEEDLVPTDAGTKLFENVATNGILDYNKLQHVSEVDLVLFEHGVEPVHMVRGGSRPGECADNALKHKAVNGFVRMIRRESSLTARTAWLQDDTGLLRELTKLLPSGTQGNPTAGILSLDVSEPRHSVLAHGQTYSAADAGQNYDCAG